jgi:hypothetical protein
MYTIYNLISGSNEDVIINSDSEEDIKEEGIFSILYQSCNYKLCKINNFEEFVKSVKVWEKNRTLDKSRVNEIIESIKTNNLVPGSFHISSINNKLKLWDGQHRFEALKKCLKLNISKDKLSSLNNFYLYENDTKHLVRKKFININKSIPVTDLWTSEELEEMEKLKVIESINYIINYLSDNFPSFYKTTKYPNRPNFNRNKLEQILFNYLKNKECVVSKETFLNKILELNKKYKKGIHLNLSGLPNTVLTKVQSGGLYLFASTKDFTIDLQMNDLDV